MGFYKESPRASEPLIGYMIRAAVLEGAWDVAIELPRIELPRSARVSQRFGPPCQRRPAEILCAISRASLLISRNVSNEFHPEAHYQNAIIYILIYIQEICMLVVHGFDFL